MCIRQEFRRQVDDTFKRPCGLIRIVYVIKASQIEKSHISNNIFKLKLQTYLISNMAFADVLPWPSCLKSHDWFKWLNRDTYIKHDETFTPIGLSGYWFVA